MLIYIKGTEAIQIPIKTKRKKKLDLPGTSEQFLAIMKVGKYEFPFNNSILKDLP